MSNQERISPYNINSIPSRHVMRIILIQYQILQTIITRTIWQMLRRITNEILGVKGIIKNFIALSVFGPIFRVIPGRSSFMFFVHVLTFSCFCVTNHQNTTDCAHLWFTPAIQNRKLIVF